MRPRPRQARGRARYVTQDRGPWSLDEPCLPMAESLLSARRYAEGLSQVTRALDLENWGALVRPVAASGAYRTLAAPPWVGVRRLSRPACHRPSPSLDNWVPKDGNCLRPRASPASGSIAAAGVRPANSSRRSTPGSPKVPTPQSARSKGRCSARWLGWRRAPTSGRPPCRWSACRTDDMPLPPRRASSGG
jgi:hypothetical protein